MDITVRTAISETSRPIVILKRKLYEYLGAFMRLALSTAKAALLPGVVP
jgi:hypothetical protein